MKINPTQTLGSPKTFWLLFMALCCCSVKVLAQAKNLDPSVIALDYLKDNAKKWHLSKTDIADAAVQQIYKTEHNGVTHVWLIQRHNGIEVFNGLVNVNILPTGEVVFAGNRFVSNLTTNTNQPTISAATAIAAVATHLGMTPHKNLQPIVAEGKMHFTFAPNGIAHQNMHANLRFQPIGESGTARLAWDLDMDAVNGNDHWNIRVDALTGAILDKSSWTVHCSFDHTPDEHTADCAASDAILQKKAPSESSGSPLSINPFFSSKKEEKTIGAQDNLAKTNKSTASTTTALIFDEGKYRVLPIPFESPNHGSLSLVQGVVDSLPSPYGWHDTTGTVGADLTITRGNNTHAFLDLKNYNRSVGDEPDGGALLNFDFPYDVQAQSDTQRNLAVTNLFYMNNVLHDISYRYGFDEKAGNFQYNNYGRGGLGRDFVSAQAQDGSKLPEPVNNNANMSTPRDGLNGRMQMYLWTRSNTRMLRITAPDSLAGSYITGTAQIGKRVETVPISGEIVVFGAGDTEAARAAACNPSKVSLAGKIVIIDRGTTLSPNCSYGKKILNAQDSGAVACIICGPTLGLLNAINDTFPLLANRVDIPIVTLNVTDCAKIRAASDLKGTIQRLPTDTVGADLVDGDLDNGIIAHEFGHGISNRLTGGPANSSCLGLGEQMGEGWSDFMALVLTAKPGDRGTKRRGIGTFAVRQDTTGRGIRRFPYSTDRTINPHTYNNIFLSQASPHPIGEIWASTIWDLYWAMVDKYGWDANIYNTQSGNGKAIQLVFDGMKMQVCNPGFIDGRNAILAADRADYNGENQCLIWEIFARRGIGYSALGGRGVSASDNEEAFDVLPNCSKAIKLTKTMTDTILPGNEFLVTLKAVNNRGIAVKDLKIVDSIPLGATVLRLVSVTATSSIAPTSFASNANTVTIQMSDSLKNGDSLVVVYRLQSDPAKKSITRWFEGFERDTSLFNSTTISGIRRWTVIDTVKNNGAKSIYARAGSTTEQILTLVDPFLITEKQPILRFLHRHNTEGGLDGGIVEVFVEGDTIWRETAKLMFKNKTTGLTYLTFPFNTRAFWGDAPQFRPTYVDLNNYKGKKIRIRFRFKSTSASSSTGWMLDDVLMMDMENYNATARLTTSQGDNLSVVADERGTIVEPAIIQVSTKELADSEVSIFPNPTDNLLTVNVNTSSNKAVLVLRTIQGQEVLRQTVSGQQSQTPLSMAGFANGLYFLSVETERGKVVKKVVKQ